jgi:hypothetical protein
MDTTSGKLFGIPYNFDKPSLKRLLSSHWQPGEGMLVEKPFGVGYTLNLASWRAWVVLLFAGALYWDENRRSTQAALEDDEDDTVEVLVD